jgi:single-stranded-DNA-specific exonuclease
MSSPLKKKWYIYPPVPPQVSQALSQYPPFFQQLLYNRGINLLEEATEYLQPSLSYDPYLMKGMSETVDCLAWAIERGEPMVVYGDYDVDGVTATALLVLVLRQYGANVTPYIPDRFEEGYGLNDNALTSMANAGVRLVITVDCGIRSPREVDTAHRLGLEIIVTDHHQPAETVPAARAVLCPKQAGDIYPYKELAGVGLAYKVAQALARRMSFREQANSDDWLDTCLDLVALGTVADVVPLTDENRFLVRKGLGMIRKGLRPGIRSLVGVAGVDLGRVSGGDIGYMLGPRLNAAGRLETAQNALDLLLTDDEQKAGLLAQNLDDQNRSRQKLTQTMIETAELQIQQREFENILFAFDTQFNSGIVGLVASRLVESHYRPAIVGFHDEERGQTRASCRSIPEFHITQALDECADLLVRHGGHAMAAGFTVRNDHLSELVDRLQAIAAREFENRELQPVVKADLEIPLSQLHPTMLTYLSKLQPTGQDNPDATFVSRNLRVLKSRAVGSDKKHLRLTITDGNLVFDAFAARFGHLEYTLPERVDVMYHFEVNVYREQKTLQLTIRDIKPSGEI